MRNTSLADIKNEQNVINYVRYKMLNNTIIHIHFLKLHINLNKNHKKNLYTYINTKDNTRQRVFQLYKYNGSIFKSRNSVLKIIT